MASPAPTESKKISVNRTRPSATGNANVTPSTPQTPVDRRVSSIIGSPSAGFRIDEENLLIFEIGSRVIRAGFAGEASPRCEISYNPEQLRRVGDYRQYDPKYNPRNRKRKRGEEWGDEYELWKLDVRDVNLKLLADRLERLIREIELTYLMLDTRTRKVGLILSSQLPKPLLEISLSSLFAALQCPTITLLPVNAMAVVSSGLRSGLVIDIGWFETSVSAIIEFREVSQKRSIRASKWLTKEYAKIVKEEEITVEEAEEIQCRLAFCSQRNQNEEDEEKIKFNVGQTSCEVVPSELVDPVTKVLFNQNNDDKNIIDDHDLPIHELAYQVLLNIPVDVRKICLSRLILTGGASSIPGLKRRFLQ